MNEDIDVGDCPCNNAQWSSSLFRSADQSRFWLDCRDSKPHDAVAPL